MKEILSSVGIILAFCVVVWLERYARGRRLFDRVSWCMSLSKDQWWVILDCHTSQDGRSLLDIIPDKYSIRYGSSDDLRDKQIIENAYKKDLAGLYFHKGLRDDWKVLSLSNEQYFMFTLYGFLIEHWDKHEFAGHEMLHFERSKPSGWGEEKYYVHEYSLSDFAVVYNKMLYATNVFCENSKGKAFGSIISRKDVIAERLDTRKIEFY